MTITEGFDTYGPGPANQGTAETMKKATHPLAPVYIAARDVIDYMDRNSGACTGELLQRLRNALVETDELQIPEFLRRKKPKESNAGLEDLL